MNCIQWLRGMHSEEQAAQFRAKVEFVRELRIAIGILSYDGRTHAKDYRQLRHQEGQDVRKTYFLLQRDETPAERDVRVTADDNAPYAMAIYGDCMRALGLYGIMPLMSALYAPNDKAPFPMETIIGVLARLDDRIQSIARLADGVMLLTVRLMPTDAETFQLRLVEFAGPRKQRQFDVQTLGCIVAPSAADAYTMSVYDDGKTPFQPASLQAVGRVLRACRSKKMSPYNIPKEETDDQPDICNRSSHETQVCCDTHYQFLDNEMLLRMNRRPDHPHILRIMELRSLMGMGYTLVYAKTRDQTLKIPQNMATGGTGGGFGPPPIEGF